MYVITFYSFKGGVGRTMALVNVAAELVRRGRKVLVVDFDLEAPGLETYKHLQPPKPHAGIVEYIAEYRRTNAVPNLLDFIYETKPIGKNGGRLWVMPAGRRDLAYRRALSKLDWQRLYKDEEGFLLFEDTKMGWAEELKPDYVLIDSRTGDTEVLGICTRQLPDSVVLMFTPNEQNLAGLENVVRDIRLEETQGLKKKIRLHFVAANVPDLDDEGGILHRHMQAFRKRLDFKNFSGLIRRYENLSLLDQSVFVLDRRHSRLARSYRRLLRTLRKDNFADREGVMMFLEDYAKLEPRLRSQYYKRATIRGTGFGDSMAWLQPRSGASLAQEMRKATVAERSGASLKQEIHAANFGEAVAWEYDEPLQEIANHFSDDVEILSKLAEYCRLQEDWGNAIHVLDRVLQLRPNLADSLFSRALCRIEDGDMREAAADLLACVEQSDQNSDLIWRCLRKLREIAPHRLLDAVDLLAAQNLRGLSRRDLAEFLCDSETGVPRAAQLLREYLAGVDEGEEEGRQTGEQLQLLLRARCWKEAIQLLEMNGIELLSADQLFCLALAYWGEKGEMPEAICRLALGRDTSALQTGSPFTQARSWLLWRIGNVADAINVLNEAEELGRGDRAFEAGKLAWRNIGAAFSFWRYRFVSVEQFLDDCREMRRMFQGEPLRPAFLGPAPA